LAALAFPPFNPPFRPLIGSGADSFGSVEFLTIR
jgi:hypothetical protein